MEFSNNQNWRCPFCNQNATINENNKHSATTRMLIKNNMGPVELTSTFIVCPNNNCNRFSLYSSLHELIYIEEDFFHVTNDELYNWDLIPQTNAKAFPAYIPKPIIEDYNEACAILKLSPKASATLARRCLQGMIRDFFKVEKANLYEEIKAIENQLDPLILKSIDVIRNIGNIGAHMEKDINLIIEIEYDEAQILIELIEQLIEEWYIANHEKNERLNKIISIGENKKNIKKAP